MSGGLITVLLLALLPGLGNVAGGLLAEFTKASPRVLNWALHAASGIVLAIVSVELLPRALDALAGWWIAAAFTAGGLAYLVLELGIDRMQSERGNGESSAGGSRMWMIYAAVATDLVSDGLMIGAGSAVSVQLALLLAAGQVLADVPEGYASIANFRDKEVPRLRRLLLSMTFVLFAVGAALLSYLLLRPAPEPIKLAALVFVAGLLTVAAVEDMLEEAHEACGDNRGSVLAFVLGFALFIVVSTGLEALIGGESNPSQTSEQGS